jgi:hypothetical protein
MDPFRIRLSISISILTQKTVSKLPEKLSGVFIPNSDLFSILDPDPGSKGHKSTGSRIRIATLVPSLEIELFLRFKTKKF